MAQSKKSKKSPQSIKSTLALVLVALLVFGINYFLGDPLSILNQDTAPAQTASASKTPLPNSSKTPAAGSSDTKIDLDGTLDAYILDVGQGDCIFLRSPGGKTMLIDASIADAFETIDAFLQEQNVEKLDVVMATHPHADHIGSMTKVINAYPIGTFYLPDKTTDTRTFEKMITALKEQNVTVKQAAAGKNALVSWDDAVEVRLLSPFADEEYDDLNNVSIMCRVKFGDTAIMLTGDAEVYAEQIALDRLDESYFKADVLKLGHHGSSTSTCEEFLNAVSPSIAIASLGEDNEYGHPHREIVALMKEYDLPFYRTDKNGTVHVTLDSQQVSVETER